MVSGIIRSTRILYLNIKKKEQKIEVPDNASRNSILKGKRTAHCYHPVSRSKFARRAKFCCWKRNLWIDFYDGNVRMHIRIDNSTLKCSTILQSYRNLWIITNINLREQLYHNFYTLSYENKVSDILQIIQRLDN